MPSLTVVTINILRELTRWPERRALLVQGLAEQNADLIALRFLEVLEGLAKDPEAQKTLDQVRRKLLVGGGASSGAASPT